MFTELATLPTAVATGFAMARLACASNMASRLMLLTFVSISRSRIRDLDMNGQFYVYNDLEVTESPSGRSRG